MSSITFGSVGDIISVCLLVKDVVDALDQSRGSSAEYQALTRELGSLERALLQVDLLSRSTSQSAEIVDICTTATQSVQHCKKSLEVFSKRISRYGHALGDSGPRKLMHDVSMKVRWHIAEKEAIVKFRAEVAAHSNALNMLLATANVKLTQGNASKLEQLESSTRTDSHQRDGQLTKVLDRIEKGTSLLLDAKTLLTKLWDGLNWLHHMGLEAKDSMSRILSLNVATYNAVLAIHSGLPNRLERVLIGDPAILEDALGRVAPVHLQFISSWEALDAVLEIRFRGLDGHNMIRDKEYILQEHATGFELTRSRPWETSILPGQRIEMSFVFSQKGSYGSNASNAACPKCGFVSGEERDLEVQCEKCKIFYRRIVEIEETEPAVPDSMPIGHRAQPEFGKSPFGPAPPPKKPSTKRKRDDGFDDALVRFKRVRLVSKQIKWRPRAVFGGSQRSKWSHPAERAIDLWNISPAPMLTVAQMENRAGAAAPNNLPSFRDLHTLTEFLNRDESASEDEGSQSDPESDGRGPKLRPLNPSLEPRNQRPLGSGTVTRSFKINSTFVPRLDGESEKFAGSPPDLGQWESEKSAVSPPNLGQWEWQESVDPPKDVYLIDPDPKVPHRGAADSKAASSTSWKEYQEADFHYLKPIRGHGSTGAKLVRSSRNGRFYIIKLLPVGSMLDEICTLHKIQHSFICKFWGTLHESISTYIVMDFVEGGELYSFLKKRQRFPNEVAKFYAAEAFPAIDFLHSRDLIHCNIRAESILLDRYGHVKLVDFGFEKPAKDQIRTRPRRMLAYTAPEVALGLEHSKSSDWQVLSLQTGVINF